MAVTTTPQVILNGAYAKSKENVPGTIATESSELLSLVNRSMRGLWSVAARVNPTFFGETVSVPFVSPGWRRPITAESVFRIENPQGAEVVVVPYDQRTAEPGKPGVYRYGQVYRSAGNTSDPTSGNLTFFHSKRPTDAAALDAVLDALWESCENFNELLMLIVARYLAEKDNRATEVAGIEKQIEHWANLYVAFLEHEHVGERRSFGHVQRFNVQTRVPILSLLTPSAPGAAVVQV